MATDPDEPVSVKLPRGALHAVFLAICEERRRLGQEMAGAPHEVRAGLESRHANLTAALWLFSSAICNGSEGRG
ncbi:MAG: hypothetical protein ABSC22_05885 [Roseiarcus sp.]|jgi:hypothetical protein